MRIAALSALTLMVVLGACSQSSAPPAQPTGPTSTAAPAVATAPVATLAPRFNPTAAVGGGANASNAISPDDLKAALGSLPQLDQLKVTANSSPPGAKGAEVLSVSMIAQDTSGLLKSMDPTGKQTFTEAILTAAGAAWPKASVSLLINDASGGTIIGSRGPGGPNTVIVS